MADSRFAPHLRLWTLVAPIMLAVGCPFLEGDTTFEISDAELASVELNLGDTAATRAADRTNTQFRHWFVESGAMKAWTSTLPNSTDISDAGATDMSNAWLRHFWMSIYRGIFRANVALSWAFGAFVFGMAMMNDGAVSRRIKAAAAGFASHVAFHVAAHATVITLGLGTSALLFPFSLNTMWWSVGALVLGVLGWRMAASFHVGR